MIRYARVTDLSEIIRVYETAREFMHTHGNPNQWTAKYPSDEELLLSDIKKGHLYVITSDSEGEKICGCFALIGGVDETYIKIYDGEWKSDSPYGTIHRIASDGSKKGVFSECFEFSRKFFKHLRVDTHKDNKPMQCAVEKCGFQYCGIIHLADGSPRLAYEWVE